MFQSLLAIFLVSLKACSCFCLNPASVVLVAPSVSLFAAETPATTTSTDYSDTQETIETLSVAAPVDNIDPKEAVKLFGRLAEKYIMLDESGGMCCYSGCSDCEYRLPGGGYRMADQSASRPKWIPSYESRSANGKSHTSKWRTELFWDGTKTALQRDEFVTTLQQMTYAPPLGGPYVAASAAKIENDTAARALFDLLANGKNVLTRHKMSVRLKQLAGGEEGLTWVMFQKAMGLP